MIVAFLSLFKNFWRDVIWRTTKSRSANCSHILSGNQKRRKTEIAYLDVHILVEEDVAHLEIAVDDALGVHVFDSSGNLNSVEADFWFSDEATLLHHIHQRAIRAQLQDNVCAFFVCEGSAEFDNIWVVHFRMNLKLGLELAVC